MVQDNFARLHGRPVSLSGADGPFQPCRWCRSTAGYVGPGVGPHLASVRCNGCGRHLGWLGRKHLDALDRGWGAHLPEVLIDDGDSGEAA